MELKLSGELASRLSGKSIEELQAELFNEEGTELKENYQDVFMSFVTDKFKKVGTDNYNRGIKKKGQDIEKALAGLLEKHSISEFSTTEEAIEALTEKLEEEPPKGDTSKLDIEKLKKLPQFQEALTEAVKKKDEQFNELKNQFDQYKTGIEQKAFQTKIVQSWMNALESGNQKPRFSGEKQEQKLSDIQFHINALGLQSFGTDSEGNPIPVDSDGNQLRDDASNPVSFSQFVKSNWKLGFDTVDPNRKFPSFKKGGEGGGSGLKISSEEEFNKLMDQAGGDFKKRMEIREAWGETLKAKEQE